MDLEMEVGRAAVGVAGVPYEADHVARLDASTLDGKG
jgi:hypothetical protein